MHVSIDDDAGEDYGTLVVQIERDDSVSLGGYHNNLTLRLPLYAREAQDIIDALTPIANAGKESEFSPPAGLTKYSKEWHACNSLLSALRTGNAAALIHEHYAQHANTAPGDTLARCMNELQALLDAAAPSGKEEAVTTGKVPIDIGGGYTVVPFGAVTLNGTFLSQLMESADGTLLVVIGPDGRALMGEGGRPYRYQTLDECRRDVETLMSVPGWKESK